MVMSRRSRSRSRPSRPNNPTPFNIEFGPGDCVCTDFADPRRLSGSNVPLGLSQLLADWLAERPDPYSDTDSDSVAPSDHAYDSDSSGRSRRRDRRSRSGSRRVSTVSRDEPAADSKSRSRGGSPRREIYVREADNANVNRRSDPRDESPESSIIIRRTQIPDVRATSEQPKISCLAFGSRVGEFAIVYRDTKGHYYLDGNLFDRLSSLQDWIVPDWKPNKSVTRAPVNVRAGACLRIFLGAEGSYFAYDRSSNEFRHNIETREFRGWLSECVEPTGTRRGPFASGENDYYDDMIRDETRHKTQDRTPDGTKDRTQDRTQDRTKENTRKRTQDRTRERKYNVGPKLSEGYGPHSLALGPNDMFCWICEKDFKVNDSFRKAFPSIERFLSYAKRKKMLSQVTFTMSTELQPGSKQPYFVLSTSDGVCVSSVPADATDLVCRYTTQWGAVNSAKRAREMKRLRQNGKTAQDSLDRITPMLPEALTLVNAGRTGDRPQTGNLFYDQFKTIIETLRRINSDCNGAPINSDEWRTGSLADRVLLILQDRQSLMPTSNETTPADNITLMKAQVASLARIAGDVQTAHKLVDGGTQGIPEETANTYVENEMKYVLVELELINEQCEKYKVKGSQWEKLNLTYRIEAIAKNRGAVGMNGTSGTPNGDDNINTDAATEAKLLAKFKDAIATLYVEIEKHTHAELDKIKDPEFKERVVGFLQNVLEDVKKDTEDPGFSLQDGNA